MPAQHPMSSARVMSASILTALLLSLEGPVHAAEPATWRIAGYLPDYRVAEYDLSRAVGLTDLILFSATPNADGSIDLSSLDKTVPWERYTRWKTEQRVRLILCLGGWGRSDQFSTVAREVATRQAFAKALTQVCLDRRLDGADIDWEHPADQAEVEAYGLLLQEVHTAFAPHGLMLTVTMAAWQGVPGAALGAVDAVQVMSYDHLGDHSTFEQSVADLKKLQKAGVPAQKLVLGLPCYGRHRERPDAARTYAELARLNLAPNINESEGFSFNGPDLIAAKVRHAHKTGLSGVMIWELGQDAGGERSLLRVIREASPSAPSR